MGKSPHKVNTLSGWSVPPITTTWLEMKNQALSASALCVKWGCHCPEWDPGWCALTSRGMKIYVLLSVYLLKPCLYSFTNDVSVFSTKQAVHTYYGLTIYVITESIVCHPEPKQYQPVRVLKANRFPSNLPSALSFFLSSPTNGRNSSVLDSGIYHFSVQESVMHS